MNNREYAAESRDRRAVRGELRAGKRFFLSLLIAHCSLFIVTAQDFGLIVNQNFTFDGDDIEYTATGIPWLAFPLGGRAGVYISGGISGKYANEEWNPVYEVYRTELMINPADNFSLALGRQTFRDTSGMIMTGLFDGLSFSWNVGGGSLNAGVFYTGLLYKEAALITLSDQDRSNYSDDNVYFASRRLAGGVNWEKTSLFDTQANLWLSGIFQFDLNDAEVKVNSQYLAGRIAVPLGHSINLECGAVLGLMQITEEDVRAAFAAQAGLQWRLPGIPNMLALGGRFSSGDWNSSLAAFTPITGETQGKVLRPGLSGIALAQAVYTIRLHETFFTELYAGYLFRTDTVTFTAAGLDAESGSPLLGAEFNLGLTWMPVSDLIFTLNGGVFLPQAGKAFTGETNIKYRLELTAGISL